MAGGMLVDWSRVMMADSGEGKRILRQKGGAREGLTTSLLSPPLDEGVHTVDFLITSCKDEPGGIFLGMADRESNLSTALGDRNCGWGWGSRMPYVSWVDRIKDGWIRGRKYPYYKTQTEQWVGFRHDMYSYDAKQVQDLLVEWKLKSHLKAFAREGVDGGQLATLDKKRMEQELGIRAAHDREKLAQRISELFEEKLSFRQGDLVRLRFDADRGELQMLKSAFPLPQEWDEVKWQPVGTPVTGLGGRGLCFAATIFHDKDVLEWRVGGKPPPAPPKGPEHFSGVPTGPGGVFPELSMWRYAQGRGDGEFARDDFTVIRHSLFGTTIELQHGGGGTVSLASSDRLEGANLYHVLAVSPSCGAVSASQWRAPSVVARVRAGGGGCVLWGGQEGIEWGTLGGTGGARAVKGVCNAGAWILQPEEGSADAWRPEDLALGTQVVECVHRESGSRLTLTASAAVLIGGGGAVVSQRGGAAVSVPAEEARAVRAVDDSGPTKQEELVSWLGEADVVPPCPSSAAVARALSYGERKRVVPIALDHGGDGPMANYNYSAQMDWQGQRMRREVVAPRSGALVMSHTDVERGLEGRRRALGGAEHLARERERALAREPGMTGHGVRRDRARADRLAAALSDREALHLRHEEGVRAEARARFPAKRLHGPGDPPGRLGGGGGRPVSSLRSRDQGWMTRLGRPGGSAGSVRDPWGQPRWEVGGEWLNLHPPIDRFKPTS